MGNSLTFYLKLELTELEKVVQNHQKDFEELLLDTFTEAELELHDEKIEAIGAIFPQPIFSELSFDDFTPMPSIENEQRTFFKSCRSSLSLEHLADFHTNPFQVTYLVECLRNFEEVLIDPGGVRELLFKKHYLEDLKKYKNIFTLVSNDYDFAPKQPALSHAISPIDLMVKEIYQELARLGQNNPSWEINVEDRPEKMMKIYRVVTSGQFSSNEILIQSGLSPKDFDDHLEKLKFFLRSLPSI